MMRVIRIANAQAFWGDRNRAAWELIEHQRDVDYVTLDYLAEVSLSILSAQRDRDPKAGFARDFLDVVRSLIPHWQSGSTFRLITNAGGLNPLACAEASLRTLRELGGPRLRIAAVSGDDVLAELQSAATQPDRSDLTRHLESGQPLSMLLDRLVTANAYLGAGSIVEALKRGADIVITGRVADPSLTVAPCLFEFDWSPDDWDRIAGATVAGHLIECGTQVTGGISTDWLNLPDATDIGYPVVEVAEDGSCVVTKPAGTGGCVSEQTVKEQLVYEIGDPARYLSPDATVSFLSLTVEDLGLDRVRVTGAEGGPPPETYKVSATYRDGFRAAGTLTIVGREAVDKARRCGEIVLERVRKAGFELRDAVIECLGAGDAFHAGNSGQTSTLETVLRVAVEADERDAVEAFSRELMPLITSGPQGTTGYAEGRPKVHAVFRYWPCLIERTSVRPHVEVLESEGEERNVQPLGHGVVHAKMRTARSALRPAEAETWRAGVRTLYDVAYARSGDKGTSANIGVIARSSTTYPFLKSWLTVERVAEYFKSLDVRGIDRYELPNLRALNFVLHGVLSRGLRTDAQGKALGQALLEMPIPNSDSMS
jgi:hypothetical protein